LDKQAIDFQKRLYEQAVGFEKKLDEQAVGLKKLDEQVAKLGVDLRKLEELLKIMVEAKTDKQ
jgi:hypothetical protein